MNFKLSDFDYHLPTELIAQTPAVRRSASRLLVVPRSSNFEDGYFAELPKLLRAGDLLVFNDSKVIPARVHALKETGGAVELLVERVTSPTRAQVMLRSSKKPLPGALLKLVGSNLSSLGSSSVSQETGRQSSNSGGEPQHTVRLIGRDPIHDDRFIVDFQAPVLGVLNEFGELPLPPYITHDPTRQDSDRYQTVYAQHLGSVAAPTAGLHFDQAMLNELLSQGIEMARVTLHVGSGTFSPVRSENLGEHRMHSEWCSIGPESAQKIVQAKQEGRRVIAVGTTSLRTLESAAARGSLAGDWETDLFITPGYEFRLVDALITNFHLPKSTLLMLVSAFAGYDRIRAAYAHAIEQKYRFFSYGDAMFLERQG
jgi:S-adenosylmethionine:tRNA ribosyltransferase-isomerase